MIIKQIYGQEYLVQSSKTAPEFKKLLPVSTNLLIRQPEAPDLTQKSKIPQPKYTQAQSDLTANIARQVRQTRDIINQLASSIEKESDTIEQSIAPHPEAFSA
jgi:hypothetical protein